MRTLSGLQPSGRLHLGNYFGALAQCLALQDRGEALYFVADLHALTSVRDGTLADKARDVALDFLALGLDPDRAIIWRQSDVAQHAELAWILGCVAPLALLERGHSYKDRLARGRAADVGILTYPVLMAADMLLYGAVQVPVGPDQKQHLEMARDLATKFNVAFVPGFRPDDPDGKAGGAPGILVPPTPLIVAGGGADDGLDGDDGSRGSVPGTDGQKMSKSYDNIIPLFGSDKEVTRRIMGITTDSTAVADPKPEPATLLTLLLLLASPEEGAAIRASWRAGGTGYGAYKKQLVALFMARFGPARARRETLAAQPGLLEAVLARGAVRARAAAAPVWNRVVAACGCGVPLG